MLRNNFFHKKTVGESGVPSLLQKEKRGSAKSDASKVLFPGIRKITNRLVAVDTVVVEMYNFSLSRDLTRPREQRVMRLYGQEPIKAIRHCSSGDMILVCHVILTG